MGYNVEFTRGQQRVISIVFEAGKVPKTSSKPSTPSNQGGFDDDIDSVDDTSGTFPAEVLRALRKIKGPFTGDYAVEKIVGAGASRSAAEAWVHRMIDEGLLVADPEGYLRLVK
jgi:hypothetical protein